MGSLLRICLFLDFGVRIGRESRRHYRSYIVRRSCTVRSDVGSMTKPQAPRHTFSPITTAISRLRRVTAIGSLRSGFRPPSPVPPPRLPCPARLLGGFGLPSARPAMVCGRPRHGYGQVPTFLWITRQLVSPISVNETTLWFPIASDTLVTN